MSACCSNFFFRGRLLEVVWLAQLLGLAGVTASVRMMVPHWDSPPGAVSWVSFESAVDFRTRQSKYNISTYQPEHNIPISFTYHLPTSTPRYVYQRKRQTFGELAGLYPPLLLASGHYRYSRASPIVCFRLPLLYTPGGAV